MKALTQPMLIRSHYHWFHYTDLYVTVHLGIVLLKMKLDMFVLFNGCRCNDIFRAYPIVIGHITYSSIFFVNLYVDL